MPDTINESMGSKGRSKTGWLLGIAFVLIMLWVIYISTQTYVVDSSSEPTQLSNPVGGTSDPTDMPDNMPGMDH